MHILHYLAVENPRKIKAGIINQMLNDPFGLGELRLNLR